MAQPAIWPFNAIWTDYYAKIARPLPKPVNLSDPANSLRFDAIFIFNDPRDWGLDTQIILDLLLSKNGILGTYSDKNGDTSLPNNGWQQDNQPCLIYSNPDLFWASSYNMPRLGQGGFRSALDGVWAETTDGATLSKLVIGKPYAETYNYAERVLQAHRNSLLAGQDESSPVTLERVFMVGDNPESDIRGANMFESPNGTKWDSILVKTGVYRDGTVPKYEPKALVDDVLSAVKWALVKQGYEHQDKDFVINALEELV
jgi:HAD superfamily hydrolase (TIGR01456 family)